MRGTTPAPPDLGHRDPPVVTGTYRGIGEDYSRQRARHVMCSCSVSLTSERGASWIRTPVTSVVARQEDGPWIRLAVGRVDHGRPGEDHESRCRDVTLHRDGARHATPCRATAPVFENGFPGHISSLLRTCVSHAADRLPPTKRDRPPGPASNPRPRLRGTPRALPCGTPVAKGPPTPVHPAILNTVTRRHRAIDE